MRSTDCFPAFGFIDAAIQDVSNIREAVAPVLSWCTSFAHGLTCFIHKILSSFVL